MQTPTRHVTTAAVMGISTDREERLLDSAGGHRVSEAPQDTQCDTESRPSPTGIPQGERGRKASHWPCTQTFLSQNRHAWGQLS